jgi:hypothetical protein
MKHLRYLAGFALLVIVGCGYHPTYSVYAKSGTPYTAPSLCQALLSCLKSEPTCYYDRTLLQTATGQTEVEECKAVNK